MKVGIDIHGTIDTNPEYFSRYTKMLKRQDVEVHITTGKKISVGMIEQLRKWEIEYDYLFSITDYHGILGTDITWDEDGNPWIDEYLWNKTKGDYCRREKIDLHIDDSTIYGEYFTTPYFQFKKEYINAGK